MFRSEKVEGNRIRGGIEPILELLSSYRYPLEGSPLSQLLTYLRHPIATNPAIESELTFGDHLVDRRAYSLLYWHVNPEIQKFKLLTYITGCD